MLLYLSIICMPVTMTVNVNREEALIFALKDNTPSDILDRIDFAVPSKEDPFAIDINCLPAIPKTNS